MIAHMKNPLMVAAVLLGLLAGCGEEPAPASDDATAPDSTENAQMANETETASDADTFLADQKAFLEANAGREGVVVRDSGLQYRVLDEGSGASPAPESLVTVHYKGALIDGTVFDSSYNRGQPAQFPASQLIRGWVEALQLMKEGDKWELVIPAELGYGDRGAGGLIPPNATLVFEVELISVDG